LGAQQNKAQERQRPRWQCLQRVDIKCSHPERAKRAGVSHLTKLSKHQSLPANKDDKRSPTPSPASRGRVGVGAQQNKAQERQCPRWQCMQRVDIKHSSSRASAASRGISPRKTQQPPITPTITDAKRSPTPSPAQRGRVGVGAIPQKQHNSPEHSHSRYNQAKIKHRESGWAMP